MVSSHVHCEANMMLAARLTEVNVLIMLISKFSGHLVIEVRQWYRSTHLTLSKTLSN